MEDCDKLAKASHLDPLRNAGQTTDSAKAQIALDCRLAVIESHQNRKAKLPDEPIEKHTQPDSLSNQSASPEPHPVELDFSMDEAWLSEQVPGTGDGPFIDLEPTDWGDEAARIESDMEAWESEEARRAERRRTAEANERAKRERREKEQTKYEAKGDSDSVWDANGGAYTREKYGHGASGTPSGGSSSTYSLSQCSQLEAQIQEYRRVIRDTRAMGKNYDVRGRVVELERGLRENQNAYNSGCL